MTSPAISVPAPDDGDCLPHDRAVWRDGPGPVIDCPASVRVSIYQAGSASPFHATAGEVDWSGVTRWRFGWPPRKDR